MTPRSFETTCSSSSSSAAFCAVVIGRNEGDHLKRCINSLSNASTIVYVDSGSTDGSVPWAKSRGVEIVELDLSAPFTAARARNAGFWRLRQMTADLRYVHFVDGDCELLAGWTERAASFLASHADVGAVCGRLHERFPDRSIYNWLCDREWEGPVGEISFCGGNAMMSAQAFETAGGFRDDLVGGEEPELCVRLRQQQWKIWRLDADMALHDADMTSFWQWWRRTERGGYAFARGSSLHGRAPEHFWVWETRRALTWGIFLPLACMIISIWNFWGLLLWLVYPAQVLRLGLRGAGRLKPRLVLAWFHVLGRFPEGWGALKFVRDRIFGRLPRSRDSGS